MGKHRGCIGCAPQTPVAGDNWVWVCLEGLKDEVSCDRELRDMEGYSRQGTEAGIRGIVEALRKRWHSSRGLTGQQNSKMIPARD